jgi:hypothetical protein
MKYVLLAPLCRESQDAASVLLLGVVSTLITYHDIHSDVGILRAFEGTVVTVVLNHTLQHTVHTKLRETS